MPKKLYIYDKTSFHDRMQAAGRFDTTDKGVVTLPVGSIPEVIRGLDELVSQGATFDRMLIQTHGNTGRIWFGDDVVWNDTWTSQFDGRNYDKLFPSPSRIYFDGCDIAGSALGLAFLKAAGSVFLKGMGGEVIAWTSMGLGMPGWWPFVGGHTLHLVGKPVTIRFARGGTEGSIVDEGQSDVLVPYPGT
ncbi:hypothetical protein ACYOEI_03175 [Singulisphaera rosea]